jgi:solute carrier family 10 (sodium/bile acid cotransporter), member 7
MVEGDICTHTDYAETSSTSPPRTATSTTTAAAAGSRLRERLIALAWEQEFLILVLAAIALARIYPSLGAEYVQPDITATWIAVCLIFFMAGLALKTDEFSKAFQQLRFNLFVQVFCFGVVSAAVYGLSRGLEAVGILSHYLADGMVVCASLPVSSVVSYDLFI